MRTGEHRSAQAGRGGFTLIEMLAVMVIIGIMAALIVPNLHGLRQSEAVDAATRQLLSDFGLARARAISGRTTVAVAFIPPGIDQVATNGLDAQEMTQMDLLQHGAYTRYALFVFRRTGDQPGHPTPRYLTDWFHLPDKTFFPAQKFAGDYAAAGLPVRAFASNDFPFPLERSKQVLALPYVAFNYEGKLCDLDNTGTGNAVEHREDTRVPVARGRVLDKALPVSIEEDPPGNSTNAYNHIYIDWLTGRARLERQQVQ